MDGLAYVKYPIMYEETHYRKQVADFADVVVVIQLTSGNESLILIQGEMMITVADVVTEIGIMGHRTSDPDTMTGDGLRALEAITRPAIATIAPLRGMGITDVESSTIIVVD